MPTITNMYNKLVSRIKMIPFIVLVLDLSTGSMYQLNHPDQSPRRDNSFTIVLDETTDGSPNSYPETYYCNTQRELEQIVNFLYTNAILYLGSVVNQEYDNLLNINIKIKYIK